MQWHSSLGLAYRKRSWVSVIKKTTQKKFTALAYN